jgi:predicted ArsR family transcriptional regulator
MAFLNPKFFETTRGQVLALLQRDARTVDEIAATLGLTDNAVRAHIVALERDGLVARHGTRPTGTRPAYSYELTRKALTGLSSAYLPVLTSLVQVLSERLPVEELDRVLTDVGQRLARANATAAVTMRARAAVAADVLRTLGGVVDIEEHDGKIVLLGRCCPLAEAVRVHPSTCRAAEGLVAELVGAPVTECCERGEHPRCRFEITLGETDPANDSELAVA